MPYHIESSAGKYEVVDDQGNVKGTHPTRKQAVAHLQALYANVPDAKELTDEEADLFEVDEDWIDSILSDDAYKSFGSASERKAAFASMADNGSSSRTRMVNVSSIQKAISEVKFQREALKKGAYSDDSKGDKRAISRNYKRSVNRLKTLVNEYQSDGYSGGIGALKKAGVKEMITEKASSDPGDYLIAEDREHPTTWHLQVRTNGKPDHRLMGAAWAALHEGYRGNKYEGPDKGAALEKLKKLYEAEKMDMPATKEAQAEPYTEQKQSILDRVIAALTGSKEGRRNSSPDGDRLQQIHDLAVLNGASCPMVMKEASGKLRWVLLSSNAFQDSDKEIISQKALESDVARTDKAAAPYGPLRWWHMGAPDPIALNAGSGADIGDCDYRAMSGRVLIESGTFRNEQIGAAVKERADTLAGSIGFFHPKDEPDNEGVYRNVVTFERSLLPRGKASNTLTALTVKGDQDMATSKEKSDALAALLGDPKLAESVIKQAEATEKAADDRGLKYKEQQQEAEKSLSGTPTAVPATGASGINPIGLAKEDKAKQAEGTPGEEKTEPKKEAASEPDWEAYAEKMKPHLMKMIEEKMKAGAKEQTEKEAGVKAALDAIAADVKELKGDLPRGLQSGFRASIADATILKDVNFKNAPSGDPLDSVIDQLMGVKK